MTKIFSSISYIYTLSVVFLLLLLIRLFPYLIKDLQKRECTIR